MATTGQMIRRRDGQPSLRHQPSPPHVPETTGQVTVVTVVTVFLQSLYTQRRGIFSYARTYSTVTTVTFYKKKSSSNGLSGDGPLKRPSPTVTTVTDGIDPEMRDIFEDEIARDWAAIRERRHES